MSAIEPAREKIVRNLQEAIAALQRDVSRVQMWAGALNSFAKPIPDYGHGQSRFDLAPATAPAACVQPQPQRQPRRSQNDDDRNRSGPARRAAG